VEGEEVSSIDLLYVFSLSSVNQNLHLVTNDFYPKAKVLSYDRKDVIVKHMNISVDFCVNGMMIQIFPCGDNNKS